jgi:Rrf2 family transcriptional regulator, iron-responsive regulator
MKLTRQTDYAIRILMYCSSGKALVTIREIAAFYGLPETFLFKIVPNLVAAGFIETVRGRGGGIRLSRPADQIRLGSVVQAVEERFELADCFHPGGTDCPLFDKCGLNRALSRALAGFLNILDEYTIEDIARSNSPSSALADGLLQAAVSGSR